jgi:hypothetical protein
VVPAVRTTTVPQVLTVGQTFTVTLVGNDLSTVLSYQVGASATGEGAESAEAAAAGLAAVINRSAPADYSALADGATVVVLNRAGHRFTLADLLVVDTTETDGPAGTAQVALLTLSGAPVVGAIWAVRIDYPDEGQAGSQTISHTVGIGQTLADIVRALALGVNARLGADFTALAEGSELILVRRSAGGFNATFATQAAPFGDDAATTAIVTLNGTPATGEAWILTLGGVVYSVTVGSAMDLGAGTVVLDTVAELAQALARLVNADTSVQGARSWRSPRAPRWWWPTAKVPPSPPRSTSPGSPARRSMSIPPRPPLSPSVPAWPAAARPAWC